MKVKAETEGMLLQAKEQPGATRTGEGEEGSL